MSNRLNFGKRTIMLAWILLLVFRIDCKVESAENPPGTSTEHWQIRAGCNGLSNDFSMLEAMARKGMNSILTGGAEHFMGVDGQPTKRLADAPTHLEGMERWQRETQAFGMQYFPLSNVYGTGDRKRWPLKRNYVTLEGKKWAHTPCPNDAKFWHGKMTNVFVEIARWAKDKPNVPGIILDAEMYGADRTTFPDACFCEDCRKEIVRELGVEDKGMDLKNKKFLKKYREASTRILERIYEQTRLQVHAVHPGFLLGGLILDNVSYDGFTPPFYKAITVAWGTPEVPVLIFSESTYSTGYHSAYARPGKPIVRSTGSYVQGQASKFGQADYPGYIQEWQQRWKDWGAHAEFVGGLWINRIPEENFAENLYHLAKNTRGYWLYDMLSLGDNPPSKLPGNGPEAYWQEITRANLELDKLLESKGAYVSKLKVRNFSLPAPSVSLELWKKVDLPLIKAAPGRAEFLSRGAEQIFYIPAARNDEIKLTIVGDSAHPTKLKEGAVAIVLVDPTGQVIKWDKLTREDFSKSRQPNGRYAGRREVSFQAPEAGTYSLFLNGGGRYAYTIGASSHPWVASLQQPKGTCLWRPKKIFVRTLPGAKQAELWFGTSNTTTVNVIDPKGRQLASGTIASGGKVTIDLPQAKAQVLMVTFEGGSIVTLTRVTGLEPWFCSSPNAPFPRR